MCSSSVVNRFASTGKLLAPAVVVDAVAELPVEAFAATDDEDATAEGTAEGASEAVEGDAAEVEAVCPAVFVAAWAAVDVALLVVFVLFGAEEVEVEVAVIGSRLRTCAFDNA